MTQEGQSYSGDQKKTRPSALAFMNQPGKPVPCCVMTPHTFTRQLHSASIYQALALSQYLSSTCTLQAFTKPLLLAGCRRSIAWLIDWQFIFKDSLGALFSGSGGLCQGPGAELSPAGEALRFRCATLDQALIKSRLLTSGAGL